MKHLFLTVSHVILIVLVGAMVVPVAAAGTPEDDLSVYLDAERLRELIADPPPDFYLVDARTPAEFAAGHIPGAIQRDYREIAEYPPTDDMDALIIVYCRSGRRSGLAVRTLERMGYTRVLDWGGIVDWPYEIVR